MRFAFADEVRAVVLDVGNTLIPIDHARIASIVTGTGTPCDEADVRLAEFRARPLLDPIVRDAARRESTDTITRYASFILEGLESPAPPSALEGVVTAWRSLWVRPDPAARSTIDALLGLGRKVGVVSNSNGTVGSLLEAAGLADGLGCVIDSGIVGMEKPDPRIFAMAAQRLNVAAGACVYLGDFLSLDAQGARAAGMHGVLLDPIGAWGEVDVPSVASLSEFVQRLE